MELTVCKHDLSEEEHGNVVEEEDHGSCSHLEDLRSNRAP